MFEFKTLPAGKYTLTVSAPGFTLYENDNVMIADQPLRLNIAMTIAVEEEKVQVSDTAPTIDVNPSNNAGAIVISGKELEALPDDPDELQSDLAGPCRPVSRPERRTDVHRWIHWWPASAKVVDSRDPHQPESVLLRIRQAGLWTHRSVHQARAPISSTASS